MAKSELTIGDVFESLIPGRSWSEPPAWPPDAFALAASVLKRSGSYVEVVREWPPNQYWGEQVGDAARDWEGSTYVRDWWAKLISNLSTSLSDVHSTPGLCGVLQSLLASADEACAGIGLPSGDKTQFEIDADLQLVVCDGLTVCREVDSSRIRVLPKQHTPQSGITVRSLSHHLALCPATSVAAAWHQLPATAPSDPTPEGVNVLVVPWPLSESPSHFEPVRPPQGPLLNMPPPFGFFAYQRESKVEELTTLLEELLEAADVFSDRVEMVIFPELSLTPEELEVARRLCKGKVLVAGVIAPPDQAGHRARNYCTIELESGLKLEQDKHHRWCLDGSQVKQYGLQGRLSAGWRWWEHTELRPRKLNFIAHSTWLTLAPLICEDLARQDPVGEILRAVGPNLVLALLMDGPQLRSRWPARYATVLAEDPGCSVLTVTSLGMVALSRSRSGAKPRMVVCLWRDAQTGEQELELPEGKRGLLLSLVPSWQEEFSADGRGDEKSGGYPILTGWEPL